MKPVLFPGLTSTWHILYGIVFTIGALASLAAGNKLPKSPNPLGSFMMYLSFTLFFMAAFTTWYLNDLLAYNNLFAYYLDDNANVIFMFFCFPLMWWLICYLFFSLGQPPHHHHQKGLMLFSALNISGIIIIYSIASFNMSEYIPGYYAMPNYAILTLDWQKVIYWSISLIALLILKHKQHHG
jgi:hypothetical protein